MDTRFRPLDDRSTDHDDLPISNAGTWTSPSLAPANETPLFTDEEVLLAGRATSPHEAPRLSTPRATGRIEETEALRPDAPAAAEGAAEAASGHGRAGPSHDTASGISASASGAGSAPHEENDGLLKGLAKEFGLLPPRQS